MRNARKNKQSMKYALYSEKEPVYLVDDNGDYITDSDGNYVETGDHQSGYSDPVEFLGNIAFASGEAEAESYGISLSDYDSKLVMLKDEIPIDETSIIFKESEPEYRSDGTLDDRSADFRVTKVQPSLNLTVYLLKRIEKNE